MKKKYEDYSRLLKSAYINAYDDLGDDKNIELVLFTNTIVDDNARKKIYDLSKNEPFNN